MKKTAMTTIVAMMLVLGVSSLAVAEHDAGDERNATFLGSTTTTHDLNDACADAIGEDECVTRIPQGIIQITCDYTDTSWDPAGLYDGLGGVSFCEIPKESTITLQYTDVIAVADFEGSVTCPETEGGDDAVTWNTEFGILSGEEPTDFDVPDWCDEASGTGHEGNTNVNIFNTAVSMSVGDGGAQAGFIVEGSITLQM